VSFEICKERTEPLLRLLCLSDSQGSSIARLPMAKAITMARQADDSLSSAQHQSPRSIDTLAVEIIRQIANQSPAASVFALSATNRALRDACNDWSVLVNLSDCNAFPGSDDRRCQCPLTLQNPRVRCLAKFDLANPKALFSIDICTPARLASTAQSLHSLIVAHSKSPARTTEGSLHPKLTA